MRQLSAGQTSFHFPYLPCTRPPCTRSFKFARAELPVPSGAARSTGFLGVVYPSRALPCPSAAPMARGSLQRLLGALRTTVMLAFSAFASPAALGGRSWHVTEHVKSLKGVSHSGQQTDALNE